MTQPNAPPATTPDGPTGSPLRGLTRRWRYRGETAGDDGPATNGHATDGPLLDRLLAARGLSDPALAEKFCHPKLTHLHPPALLPGIDLAAERLASAVRENEVIVIYGDYDVDGITACAILYHALRVADPAARVRTYIPHRLEEGYGLSSGAIRQLAEEGASVIVSVDCGISAVEPARTAREAGVDLIITDHHAPPAAVDALPDTLAVVHPGLPGSEYPFAELCGAGVAFKLAWHFATRWCGSERVSDQFQRTLLDLLPLAALGTIADVVPLLDENRVLASIGLTLIKRTPLVGLRALIEACDLMDEAIDCEKVGFVLAPRLNACGRMGHAAEAVHMFTDASPEEARRIAQSLAQQNEERKRTERSILTGAMQLAEDRGMTSDERRIIVLADESWHPGVVGIVCSRLVERFGRPAILMKREGDLCRGSARSIDGFSICDALEACTGLLTTHGGHDMAAGLSLPTANLPAFVEAITAHANERISIDDLTPSLKIDCDADLGELTFDTVQRIAELSPFGRANPRPVVRVNSVRVTGAPRQIGAQGRHLSLQLHSDGPAGRSDMRVVWWNAGNMAGDLAAGMRLDVALHPKLNTWRGRTTVEGEIRDVRLRTDSD